MASRRPLVIYGGGGFAREVAWLAEQVAAADGGIEPVCFADDDEKNRGRSLNDLPVLSIEEASRRHPNAAYVIGVGSPSSRELMAGRADLSGLEAVSLIHPRVEKSRWIEIAAGTVICAGNVLTTNIRLGSHVQINLDCTVGHDVEMAPFATLAPGVHVSGCVHIGRGVYIGTGAVLINGTSSKPLVVGDGAVIGAGACVIKDVEAGTTVAGVPAKQLSARSQ